MAKRYDDAGPQVDMSAPETYIEMWESTFDFPDESRIDQHREQVRALTEIIDMAGLDAFVECLLRDKTSKAALGDVMVVLDKYEEM